MKSQAAALVVTLLAVCSRIGRAADENIGVDQGEVDEPTDEEIEALENQMKSIFQTLCAVVGTVLAVILGFYGWTFWTSIKCYFESKAIKAQNAKHAPAAASSSTTFQPKSPADNSESSPESEGKIDRTVRKVGPYRLQGEVVNGFGRGSSELGWPTANLDPAAFESKIDDSEEGVYVGWAQVVDSRSGPSPVYKSLVSVGWNPAYDNEKKTVEAFICHSFPENFYGAELRLAIVGYMRPQVYCCIADDSKSSLLLSVLVCVGDLIRPSSLVRTGCRN